MQSPRRVYDQFLGQLDTLDGAGLTIAAITGLYEDQGSDTTLDTLPPGAESDVVARTTTVAGNWVPGVALRIDPTSVAIDTTGETDLAGWLVAETSTGKVVSLLRFVTTGDVPQPRVGAADTIFAPPNGDIAYPAHGVELEARITAVESAAVPTGGTTGQVLAKASNQDLDAIWTDPTGDTGGSGGGAPAPAAVRLGAASYVDPASVAGPYTLPDQGRAGIDYHSGGQSMAPIRPDAWTGLRALSRFTSEVGPAWPSAGFHLVMRKVTPWRRGYAPGEQWYELFNAHFDPDGELADLFEIACVEDVDGTFAGGINLRCNGEEFEYLAVTDTLPVTAGVEIDSIDVKLNPATGIVSWSINGGSAHTAALSHEPASGDTDPPTLPLTIVQPDADCPLWIGTSGTSTYKSARFTDYADTTVYVDFNLDDATDGDTTVTTSTHTFSDGGLVLAAPTRPTLVSYGAFGWLLNDGPLLDIAADESVTLVIVEHRPWAALGDLGAWWARNWAGLGGGEAGWAFASAAMFDLAYGFVISDGAGTTLFADTGASWPTVPHLIAAVLDRSVDELRLYTCLPGARPVLAATVDASALGAVSPDAPVALGAAAGLSLMTAGPAVVRRVLDVDEIAYLAADGGA